MAAVASVQTNAVAARQVSRRFELAFRVNDLCAGAHVRLPPAWRWRAASVRGCPPVHFGRFATLMPQGSGVLIKNELQFALTLSRCERSRVGSSNWSKRDAAKRGCANCEVDTDSSAIARSASGIPQRGNSPNGFTHVTLSRVMMSCGGTSGGVSRRQDDAIPRFNRPDSQSNARALASE